MSDKFSAGSGPVLSFKPKLLFNFPFIFPLQDSRLTYLNLPTKRPAFSGNKKKRHFEFCSPLIKNLSVSYQIRSETYHLFISLVVQLSDFLFGKLGLEFGSNAVITNGRVSFCVPLHLFVDTRIHQYILATISASEQ